MKRRLVLLCVCLLSFTLLFVACSSNEDAGTSQNENGGENASESGDQFSFPLDEPIELDIFAVRNAQNNKDFDEMEVIQEWQDTANIEVNWSTVSPDDLSERKNLLFASQDLPDAFYGSGILNNNEVVEYGTQGLLIPLEDLIEEYAPNLTQFLDETPELRAKITAPDGHIYALPNWNAFDRGESRAAMFINKNWLDQLEMDVPETTEELYQALKAFSENDMNGNGENDEIPLSFLYNATNENPNSLSGAFGKLDPHDRHLHVDDGTVYFTPMEPEYKEYVNYMHRLYSEGLIDPEAFTQDFDVYMAKIQADGPQVGAFFAWSRSVVFGQDEDEWEYVPVPALEGPQGDQYWIRAEIFHSMGAFAISSENEHPEKTLQWIDLVYDEIESVKHAFGPFGSHLEEAEGGRINLHWPPDGVSEPAFRHQETPGATGVWLLRQDTIIPRPSQEERMGLAEFYSQYFPDEFFPNMLLSESDVQELNIIEPEIIQENGFIESKFAEWVINGNVDEEWDEYIDQLQRMDVDRMVEIYQENYDRYMETLGESQ